MSATKKNKSFDWEKGNTLDDKENYSPMGDVRVKGLPKLKRALHADPETRKKERDNIILNKQSKPYKAPSPKDKEKPFIVEESQSGLSDQEYEDSKVKKLIDHGKKFRGVDRFGKKK